MRALGVAHYCLTFAKVAKVGGVGRFTTRGDQRRPEAKDGNSGRRCNSKPCLELLQAAGSREGTGMKVSLSAQNTIRNGHYDDPP